MKKKQRLLKARIAASQICTDLEMENAENEYNQKQTEKQKQGSFIDEDDIQMPDVPIQAPKVPSIATLITQVKPKVQKVTPEPMKMPMVVQKKQFFNIDIQQNTKPQMNILKKPISLTFQKTTNTS